jgi:hypothetical protein
MGLTTEKELEEEFGWRITHAKITYAQKRFDNNDHEVKKDDPPHNPSLFSSLSCMLIFYKIFNVCILIQLSLLQNFTR